MIKLLQVVLKGISWASKETSIHPTTEGRITMARYFLLIAIMSTVAFTSMTCHTPTGPPISSDTTSHGWTFTIIMLGGASGSALYDVAIVNDTDAWAVGEIYIDSSSGNVDPFPYGGASWNGQSWRLQRIPYFYQGQPLYGRTYSVLPFGISDIWFGIGNLIHLNGGQYIPIQVGSAFNGRILKMWGTNAKEFYIVGEDGSIAQYGNGNWKTITSGTSLNLLDVYGLAGTVLAVASYPGESLDKEILQISGTTVTQLSTNGIQWPLTSVWFVPGHYYVVGQGIYEKTSLSQTVWQQDSVDTVDFFSCIQGNAWNDFFIAGSNGQLLHFNGKSWQSYQNLLGLQSGGISRIAVNGNLMIGVGYLGSKAVAFVGRRG